MYYYHKNIFIAPYGKKSDGYISAVVFIGKSGFRAKVHENFLNKLMPVDRQHLSEVMVTRIREKILEANEGLQRSKSEQRQETNAIGQRML